MKILAIPGSVSKNSLNKMAVHNLAELAPEGVMIEVYELNDLPMFNVDLEKDLPAIVTDFIQKVREADVLVISTPEYNNMIPGVLKNAFEWLSRDAYSSDAIAKKLLGIMGASDGGFGTVRAQMQLMQLGAVLNMRVSGKLRLPISHADKKFDNDGNLIDDETKQKMSEFLVKLKNSI